MTTANEYNDSLLLKDLIRAETISVLTKFWQEKHDLLPDGKLGPITVASTVSKPKLNTESWEISNAILIGARTQLIQAHPSWHGDLMGMPKGIVAHYSATDPGTARNMANRRSRPFGQDPDDRMSSWHASVETDGFVIQMVPFTKKAWHAGSDSAKSIPGVGWANYTTVGIELIGFGKAFTKEQVLAAKKLWRSLVQTYNIPRQYAMIPHSSIDPERRDDPGPVWMNRLAEEVLDYAYA